jgi:hypothetical protein
MCGTQYTLQLTRPRAKHVCFMVPKSGLQCTTRTHYPPDSRPRTVDRTADPSPNRHPEVKNASAKPFASQDCDHRGRGRSPLT